MTCYAGIDVSLATGSICIVDGAGTIIRELKAPSDPDALGTALAGTGLAFARVGLEAGPPSQWLHAGRQAAGLPVVLLETRQLRAMTKAMPVKTDRSNARALAQLVRTGWFRPVHVKSELSQELRTLLTGRRLPVAKLRDVENGIRGLLLGFGLKMGPVSERAFPARARALANGRKSLAAVTLPLLLVRETLLCQRERLHRLVVTATRGDAACRRLMTVPGVGPVTALTFCSAVDDPARFSRSRAVGAHFGLTPRRYQSGATDRVGQISKQGDGMARQALHEAANVLLTRTSRWPSLKALGRLPPAAPEGDGSGALRPMGMSLAKRAGMRRAKVAVARKLAVVLHRMWCDGTGFRWSKETAAA